MNSERVASLLLSLLILGSLAAWWQTLARWLRGDPLLPAREGDRRAWSPVAAVVVALWVLQRLAERVYVELTGAETGDITLQRIQLSCAMQVGLVLVLLALLSWSRRPLEVFGIEFRDAGRQAADGALGFLLSVAPVWLILLATMPLREPELQHSFLKFLRESPTPTVIGWVGVSAVVLAPLAEELAFRVILQGSLERFLPAPWAIGVVAVLFCLVHGWVDVLPLLPLAVVLGYVYHRRRRYLSVVVLHGLFNGSMLLMQLLTLHADSSPAS